MTTLRQALQATSWRLLITIGRQRQLKLDSNLRKADLVDILHQTLLRPANLSPALARLAPPARQLLSDLQLAGGRLTRRHLSARYGSLRPTAKIVKAARQQAKGIDPPASPDHDPLSTVEQLYLFGLIFLDQDHDDLFIPEDILPLLPSPPPLPRPALRESGSHISPADLACHDLAYLLALLQRDDISPRHGRWLTPNLLIDWGRGCRVPPASPHARGELQTGRRRFLHYLAENAGFIPGPLSSVTSPTRRLRTHQSSVSGQKADNASRFTPHASRALLKATPTAWLWLNASRPERLQQLWQCWSSPDPDRWRAFRLPGAAWMSRPEALLAVLRDYLPRLDPADPTQFARLLLAQQPDLLDLLPATLLEPETTLIKTVVQLLTGPLVWLGALRITDRDSESETLTLSLTLEGLAWLRGEPLPPDAGPVYRKFSIETDFQPDPLAGTFRLNLVAGLPEPVDLVTALNMAEKSDSDCEETPSRSPYRYRLTAPSFIRALHRGWSPPALVDALNRLADRPLTGQETALLRTWAEAAGKMTIRHAAILETVEPDIISRLASTRRGRDLIHRTLSPRAVIVDPARLDLLVRRLMEQEGVPPRQIGRGDRDRGRVDRQSLSLSLSDLWLAVEVYRRLGQLIRLPVRIPQRTIDDLTSSVTPTDLAAADIAAEQVLAAIKQLIEGRTPFPPWPEEGLSLDDTLPVIEAALESGQGLELHYYAASTDTITRRLVEPYRLEWHGGSDESNRKSKTVNRKSGTPYLIGFCHRAQAERMFRLDRIQQIAICDRDSGQIETSESDSEGEGDKEGDNWTDLL